MILRPYRSVLYIPSANARALEKVKTLAVDAIIFDLEDAVSVGSKDMARDLLTETLRAGGFGARAQIVRINGFDTPWGADDLAQIANARPQAVLLPKVNSAADITDLAARMDAQPGFEGTKIWAMMETPHGIINAVEIAAAPRMGGLIMGTNDLAKDLNSREDPSRVAMQTSLGMCVLAAKAAGIAVIDGVYNAFKDDDGLTREATQGRDMGFDGKTVIHPAQVAIANDIFGPTQAEQVLGQRYIEAYEAAVADGQGIAVVDGKIVENLHVETAKAMLARAQIIEELRV